MPISFAGAKKYKKHNGFSMTANINAPLPSPMHFYSLKQGGLTLSPLIKENDIIMLGQKIADMTSFNSVPVISSVSGKVVSVSEDTIAVENDMLYNKCEFLPPSKSELTTRETLWLLREGAVCESRNGIPLHVLIGKEKTPDCVIVCCFDSDPYVSSPQMSAKGNAVKILKGLDIAMRITGAKKAYIAVENDTKKTYYDFKYHLRYNKKVQLYMLKARYPQSNDEILIKTITGKSDINAIILSPETLCNAADALETGIPVTKKIVTVSGDDILPANNFLVPIGQTFSSLLESAGYLQPKVVINGGVIDGERITDFDIAVNYSTNAVLAFNSEKNLPSYRKNLSDIR